MDIIENIYKTLSILFIECINMYTYIYVYRYVFRVCVCVCIVVCVVINIYWKKNLLSFIFILFYIYI